jgi:wyosine [tRNA(Phe)-imidazoG37] synthetase (radical SAM superfamily)
MEMEETNRLYIYGPVPSRRLGFSLGIDIIPYKTCSLDCIYCQLGSTKQKTVQRKKYFSERTILEQIKQILNSDQKVDYITFSGSGEPTLNSSLGNLIKKIREITSIPVAVLTNGTLLTKKPVRKALLQADLVVPSLDAATQDVFERINRPHPSLHIQDIIEGLKEFRQEFQGSIWLEILLVKGVNDSPSHIQKLKQATKQINPDRIQLNTVVRPPAEDFAQPLSFAELQKIQKIFGRKAEIIADFDKIQLRASSLDLKDAVLAMVQRRPVTLSDLAASLGKHKNELLKYLDMLFKEKKIKLVTHKGQKYYEPLSCGNHKKNHHKGEE